MSGMNVSGRVMVQEAQAGGFECHVYPSRVAAALQLLRAAVRRAADTEDALAQVEVEVAELIAQERAILEDEDDDQ
jgi:3-hydroxyisobutyrate dehydrogenase-like beta-hydroxyacid dehydrogenase